MGAVASVRPLADEPKVQASLLDIFNDETESHQDEDSGKPYIEAMLDVDTEGRVHVILPATVDIAKLRRASTGTPFVTVKCDPIDVNVTTDDPNAKRKERVLSTYPPSFRLTFKMK